ncbi:alpha/beta fold hydrolase, partial [Mycobacteroides abscessus]|nr:alpha/beta fold hydrolase [Mycobacteroides abscessus]
MSRLSTFTNDGLTFDVIDEGALDGPVIVALHGFPERATMWEEVIPQLTGAGFRVLAPNQRGYSPG